MKKIILFMAVLILGLSIMPIFSTVYGEEISSTGQKNGKVSPKQEELIKEIDQLIESYEQQYEAQKSKKTSNLDPNILKDEAYLKIVQIENKEIREFYFEKLESIGASELKIVSSTFLFIIFCLSIIGMMVSVEFEKDYIAVFLFILASIIFMLGLIFYR